MLRTSLQGWHWNLESVQTKICLNKSIFIIFWKIFMYIFWDFQWWKYTSSKKTRPKVENSSLSFKPSHILTWQLFSIRYQRFQAWPDRRWVILYEFSKLWKSESLYLFWVSGYLSSKFTIWKTTYPYHFLLLSKTKIQNERWRNYIKRMSTICTI